MCPGTCQVSSVSPASHPLHPATLTQGNCSTMGMSYCSLSLQCPPQFNPLRSPKHTHTHCHQHPPTERFLCCSPFVISIIIAPSQQPLPTPPPLPPPVTVKIALIMSSILFPPSTLCTNLYYKTSRAIVCFWGIGLSVWSLGAP